MGIVDRFEEFHPLARTEWRGWLEANHESSPGVWFVYFKKHTARPRVSYEDAVSEALCYGWIDSLQRRLDEDRTKLLFTPRKAGSVWSKPNKIRVDRMIAEGLMTDAGFAKIDAARKDGSWNALDEVDKLVMPDDLVTALEKDEAAARNFEAFSPSATKAILYWLSAAKRNETRVTRIGKIVRMAAANKRAVFDKE